MVSSKWSQKKQFGGTPKICKVPPKPLPQPPIPVYPPTDLEIDLETDRPYASPPHHDHFQGTITYWPSLTYYSGTIYLATNHWADITAFLDVPARLLYAFARVICPGFWDGEAYFDTQPVPDPWTDWLTLPVVYEYELTNSTMKIRPA